MLAWFLRLWGIFKDFTKTSKLLHGTTGLIIGVLVVWGVYYYLGYKIVKSQKVKYQEEYYASNYRLGIIQDSVRKLKMSEDGQNSIESSAQDQKREINEKSVSDIINDINSRLAGRVCWSTKASKNVCSEVPSTLLTSPAKGPFQG